MNSLTDFSDAEQQRSFEVIPPGVFCRVRMELKPGKVSLPNHNAPEDAGLFTRPKDLDSDVIMLAYELTVVCGPWARRKIFGQFIISGGKLDGNGISKGWLVSKPQIRAILESARGIDPNDDSPHAKEARSVTAFRDLHGVEFAIKIGVETDPTYGDKNVIDRILVEGDCEYPPIMDGEDVPPDPRARVRTRRQPGAGAPASAPVQDLNRWASARPTQPVVSPSPGQVQAGLRPKWSS